MKRALFFGLFPLSLFSLPQGHEVVGGSATVVQEGSTLQITTSDKAILNFNSYNIGPGETVHYHQPSSSSAVLNRIRGGKPSEIFGKIRANGKVFLINPSGILFKPGAEINTGSFVVSTLDIENKDFLEGKYRFKYDPSRKDAKIQNEGYISAAADVALIAPVIHNSGTIVAHAGSVALGCGQIVTLDFGGDGLMSFAVEGEVEQAVASHLGMISAQQGDVAIRLNVARSCLQKTINVDGIEIGTKMEVENGVVRIVGDSKIDANNIDIEGRSVEISGQVFARGKLSVAASDAIRFRSSHSVGEVSLSGRMVAIGSQIRCRSLKLHADEEFQIGAGIETANSELRFDARVLFTAPDVTLSTGSVGGSIAFEKSVDCDPRSNRFSLTLLAGSGSIEFHGPLGLASKIDHLTIGSAGNVVFQETRVGSLVQNSGIGATSFLKPITVVGAEGMHLNCVVANIEESLQVLQGSARINNSGSLKIADKAALFVKGDFDQKGAGEVILGGSVTSEGSVSFRGPVRPIKEVSIEAVHGTVLYASTVDGPGGLNIAAENLIFRSDIGKTTPLSNLKAVAGRFIELQNIGGEASGISGVVDLFAKEAIRFKGSRILANTQNYRALQLFEFNAGMPISLVAAASNAPITFQDGQVRLMEGSDLSLKTTSGDVSFGALRGTNLQNVKINAGQGRVLGGSIGSGGEIGDLLIEGQEIALSGPVYAARAKLCASKSFSAKGDIVATTGDLIFCGQVEVEHPKAEFAALRGDLVFGSNLVGLGDLTLRAEKGTIRFNGNIGTNTHRFKSLLAIGQIIDQNGQVILTGPLIYQGSIHLGGGIRTTGNAIIFDGPVLRDHHDTCYLSTGGGKGPVVFHSTLDADLPTRGLQINADRDIVCFHGTIGANGPLNHLNVYGGEITIGDIGGKESDGVVHNISIKSKKGNRIELKGSRYFAKTQDWEADSFIVAEKGDAYFRTAGGALSFSGGKIDLQSGHDLYLSSHGGKIEIGADISSQQKSSVHIDAGGGKLSLGTCEGIKDLDIKNAQAQLQSDIRTGSLSIASPGRDVKLTGHVDVEGGISIASGETLVQNSVEASSMEIRAGDHKVTLDSKIALQGPLDVSGGDIWVLNNIETEGDIRFEAQRNIFSRQRNERIVKVVKGEESGAVKGGEEGGFEIKEYMRARGGDIYLNAKGANVGEAAHPVMIKAEAIKEAGKPDKGGRLFVGSKSIVFVVGDTADGQIHMHPSNPPDLFYFNGQEGWGKVYARGMPIDLEEEIISAAPDMLIRGRSDYIDSSSLLPRRALIFYQRPGKIGAAADDN